MQPDPIDEFMRSLQHPSQPSQPAPSEADLFSGSEPVAAAQAPAAAQPVPDVPAASAPAVVGDVLNTTADAVIAELIRRVQAIEAYLRRQGADL